MQNQPALPPTKIEEVPKGVRRPLWSVVIPTYNCAHYLKETLQSVLMQDFDEDQMEIIVVDDHSTKDDPEAVVRQLGQGRVQFLRQKQNVGKVKNYETGLQAAKGRYIHQLHGDDMVRPGFYSAIAALFEQYPDAAAAFCRTVYIDEQGRWTGMTGMLQVTNGIVPNMTQSLYVQQLIQTPSMVVKRGVYETLGTFDRRLNCLEDWEMWIRIANRYPIATTHEVLALYRIHGENATQLTFEDGSALTTYQLVCNIVDTYIHPDIKRCFSKQRSRKQGEFWLLSYKNMKPRLGLKQRFQYIARILKFDFSLKNIYRLFF